MKNQYWICDSCGERIIKIEDGWVEWISYQDEAGNWKRRNLRLVHHFPASPRTGEFKCQFNQKAEFAKDKGIVGDLSLEHFLGHGGLMTLLSFLDEDGTANKEILEMIKRLHVPGYEIARIHMEQAIGSGAVETNTHPGYPSPNEIKRILEYIQNEKLEED